MEEPSEHTQREASANRRAKANKPVGEAAAGARNSSPATTNLSSSTPKVFGPEEGYIIGFNVERLRKHAGISKVRFCNMLGIGRPTLDRIEDGEGDVRLSLLVKMAEALEVRAVDLMTLPQAHEAVDARKILGKRQEARHKKGARKTSGKHQAAKARAGIFADEGADSGRRDSEAAAGGGTDGDELAEGLGDI